MTYCELNSLHSFNTQLYIYTTGIIQAVYATVMGRVVPYKKSVQTSWVMEQLFINKCDKCLKIYELLNLYMDGQMDKVSHRAAHLNLKVKQFV